MLKRSAFLLLAGLTTVSAHATFSVWVDGQTLGIAGTASYSQYVPNVNTTVSGDKALHSPNNSNATFGSLSSIGVLKAYAQVDTPNFNLIGDTTAWARAQYTDVITVGGSGPVTLQFTMPTTGTFSAGSFDALGSASLSVMTVSADLLYLSYRERLFKGTSTIEQNSTSGQVTVDPGTQLLLSGYLVASARVVYSDPNALMSGVDFSHTSLAFIDVLTPGGSVASQSGHNYAPIPEPQTYALMLAGLGAIGFATRRRAA